jgi:hypothetical protein
MGIQLTHHELLIPSGVYAIGYFLSSYDARLGCWALQLLKQTSIDLVRPVIRLCIKLGGRFFRSDVKIRISHELLPYATRKSTDAENSGLHIKATRTDFGWKSCAC